MRKTLLSIAAIALLFSCSIGNENKKYATSNSDEFYSLKEDQNFIKVRYVKPSESMQVGIPKKDIFANKTRRNYYEDVYYEDEDGKEEISYQSNDENDEAVFAEENITNEKYRGYFKIGTPYNISGSSYFPENYDNFEEVGTSSWYGAEFHGKETANGEIYNSGEMTAAHRTLPLPSMVRVTNLNNGKSVIVRVNDRGPFAKNRVIDVSEKAAEVLGFKNIGTADVKVELLRSDTDELLDKLKIKN
jgi:rare lipoprotein A (peptidoglycan hydrolase)